MSALVSVKTGAASTKVLRDKEVALCILKVPPLSVPSTNIPIACEYFYDNISVDYEYFLWLDGDVLVKSKLLLPTINNNDVMFIYNNEFYSKEFNKYITFSSENYLYDHDCYINLTDKLGFKNKNFRATNSWIVYAKSKNNLWKEVDREL